MTTPSEPRASFASQASSASRTPRRRVIMHVDMDAFYASVEMARHPELAGLPLYVGGADRGVVLAANYEARKYGIHSGIPALRARRLCPQVVALPPDHDTYAQVSAGVFAIFNTVTNRVEAASIDEAFLDITGSRRRLGDPAQIGERVRAQVADEQRIPASVGIGPNKFIAKLASRQAKPDGLVQVGLDEVISFLHPLPVERIWGVGPATADKLHRLGLTTIAEVAHTSRETLQRAFGARLGAWLFDLAWGIDNRAILATDPDHSVGAQTTFNRDTDDPRIVHTELLRMSARTASRLRSAGYCGRTVTISVQFADMITITRTSTLPSPSDVTDEIYATGRATFDALHLQRARIRRVGVRVGGLVDTDQAYIQPTLDAPDAGMRQAEMAADAAILRFGPRAVQRASLTRIEPGGPPSSDTLPD